MVLFMSDEMSTLCSFAGLILRPGGPYRGSLRDYPQQIAKVLFLQDAHVYNDCLYIE